LHQVNIQFVGPEGVLLGYFEVGGGNIELDRVAA
jgi:hypothetical protein